jgi:hypothetical protein
MTTLFRPIAPQIRNSAVDNVWTGASPEHGPGRAWAASMPDPFWLIVGFIAIACVLLFPVRLWMLSRHRHETDEPGGDQVPLAPPERRNRG